LSNSKLPEFGIVRLADLPMHAWSDGHTLRDITILDSPYYVALERNDPAVFLAYQEVMRGLPSAPSEITWEQFLDLRDDIARNGLRDLGDPIMFRNNGQVDGHHRLAILCHLHGQGAEVLVADGIVTFPSRDAPPRDGGTAPAPRAATAVDSVTGS
jgi:hypothetical protein